MWYRRLEAGEIIQEGDEVDGSPDPWRDDPDWQPTTCVGQPAPDPHHPSHPLYRRPISPFHCPRCGGSNTGDAAAATYCTTVCKDCGERWDREQMEEKP